MGTWGYGPLENDDAADWLDELLEDQEFFLLSQAFDDVFRPGGRQRLMDMSPRLESG
jgi:hypothetical protein